MLDKLLSWIIPDNSDSEIDRKAVINATDCIGSELNRLNNLLNPGTNLGIKHDITQALQLIQIIAARMLILGWCRASIGDNYYIEVSEGFIYIRLEKGI